VSSSASQLSFSADWKQEVNRRIAAHRRRRGAADGDETALDGATTLGSPDANGRGARAAARVAARYAKAPSYNEAGAVRAAEAASAAALEAEAAAQSLLAGLESVSEIEAEPASLQIVPPVPINESPEAAEHTLAIRWDVDFPVRAPEAGQGQELREFSALETTVEKWREAAFPSSGARTPEEIEVVEPARSIPANLIEFPRELVATRKMRPRIVEGAYGAQLAPGEQLSIFEVDPAVVSIQAGPETAAAGAAGGIWVTPEWSAIELGPEPILEPLPEPAVAERPALKLELAPLNRRLMAVVVDTALVVAVCVVVAFYTARGLTVFPGIRAIEVGAAAALVAVAAVYQTLFFTLARATPGMRFAGLSLSTFTGQLPTRGERCTRLTALLLSVLPLGIGIAWSIFDEDHLCWHDRLSLTYLRRG
jgi:uncharacterized RDD family membrane protein YckC